MFRPQPILQLPCHNLNTRRSPLLSDDTPAICVEIVAPLSSAKIEVKHAARDINSITKKVAGILRMPSPHVSDPPFLKPTPKPPPAPNPSSARRRPPPPDHSAQNHPSKQKPARPLLRPTAPHPARRTAHRSVPATFRDLRPPTLARPPRPRVVGEHDSSANRAPARPSRTPMTSCHG
jgi:hypothetical protein